MQIRIRTTGQVLLEHEWIKWVAVTYAKSISVLTPEVFDMFDSDPVFEGPQATGGTIYQYSQPDGVEQIENQWYTKYILGPVFTDTVTDGVTTTAAEHQAAYIAMKDAEFQAANAAQAKQELLATDWSELPSVRNTAVTPHLTNAAAFDTYRLALRAIAINPPTTVAEWPVRPDATWSEPTP